MFVGPSSGAIFNIALKKTKKLDKGLIVAMAPDGGEKYLSTSLCDPTLCIEAVRKFGIQCSYKNGKPVTEVPNTSTKETSPQTRSI